MRAIAVVLVALVLAPALVASAAPTVRAPCRTLTDTPLVDDACPAPIHPGAMMWNGCTLGFLVTDGIDVYAMTAAHCVGPVGSVWRMYDLPQDVGVVSYRGTPTVSTLPRDDFAFAKIDREDVHLASGTMAGWAGPTKGPTGVATRSPVPGEVVLQYGYGHATMWQEATRGRPGVVAYAWATDNSFAYVGPISGGDSGSPVTLATGEALGISVAAILPNGQPTLVFGIALAPAMRQFEQALGRPLTLVEGDARLAIEL